VFLTGWARKASEGLVGIAKRDGEWCAEVVTRYLATQAPRSESARNGVIERLRAHLKDRKSRPVDRFGLRVLESVEKAHAGQLDCIGEFKLVTNESMLGHIERGSA
jgi:ferredoxin--NADP+ reductase